MPDVNSNNEADNKTQPKPEKAPKVTWREIFSALKHRKSGAMFILGMAAGLPYVLITGTLNAWFTAEDISVKTIGVFSWISILLGFKFLWSPAIDRTKFPAILNMGQRRAGILLLQAIIVPALISIAFLDPTTQIGIIAIAAIVCTVAFASQDILIDAWRIEVADEVQTVDLLSSVYQIGYRLSAVFGGAGALIAASRIGWENTFIGLSFFMVLCMSGVFIAENTVEKHKLALLPDENPPPGWRNMAVTPVLMGWICSIIALFSFMAYALTNPETADASAFTINIGPLIIFVSIIFPVLIAALLMWLYRNDKDKTKGPPALRNPWRGQSILDILYGSIIVPMVDLIDRLKFGAILVLILALSYRFTDLIWGSFAYPFYLGVNFGALAHTKDEVALASKIFGAFMTTFGIIGGGMIILRIGRMPALVLGGILAAATNLLFADLALSASVTDAVLEFLHIYKPMTYIFQPFVDFVGLDVTMNKKMVQLMMVIAAENLSVGFASAAIVVYLSSIVNPKHAAVQYALLASLSLMIGTLGRPWIGELIEERGFAFVFFLTTAMGSVAVIASIAEWVRQSYEK